MVNSVLSGPRSEKILPVLGSDGSVMAINYSEIRLAGQDISVDVVAPEKGAQHIFKTEPLKKEKEEELTFFQQYV